MFNSSLINEAMRQILKILIRGTSEGKKEKKSFEGGAFIK